jgi:hypothetical protein
MRHRARVRTWAAVLIAGAVSAVAAAGGGIGSIKTQDLREWLSYIASDELQGVRSTAPASASRRHISSITFRAGV